jgi:hypothetical protein
MRLLVFIFIGLIIINTEAFSNEPISKKTKPIRKTKYEEPKTLCYNVVGILNPKTKNNENYILDKTIYELKLDTLPQIKLWRNIMNLHQDSAIVNIGNSRNVIQKIKLSEWYAKPDSVKKAFKDSLRFNYRVDSGTSVFITAGKKFFYDFEKTSQNFHKGINCFVDNGVDPWYAQAILLIESPNKLQKSTAGAYGPFQLMKDVARLYGLKVNREVDERADFERSAFASSSLIKTICIPQTRKMLDNFNITQYNESDLWFKLLVMHVYHAGSYNVQCALNVINPQQGSMDIIFNLWQTKTAKFKNSSQNYSQLVLAAMIEMNQRVMVKI